MWICLIDIKKVLINATINRGYCMQRSIVCLIFNVETATHVNNIKYYHKLYMESSPFISMMMFHLKMLQLIK